MNLRNFVSLLLLGVATFPFSSCVKKGCTDPLALNYYEAAEEDDGSCLFFDSNNSSLPIILSGVYEQPVELKNFNDPNDPTGLTYDYQVNAACTFEGGLIIEAGVRILVNTNASIALGDSADHQLVGTAEEPIIIDGATGSTWAEEYLFLNGTCEVRHVHMNSFSPFAQHVVGLSFTDNIVVDALRGFDFRYMEDNWWGDGEIYHNPQPFVLEFERNTFSDLEETDALAFPISMLSNIGTTNTFDIAVNQHIRVGDQYFTGSFIPLLEGDHVWKNLNVSIVMYGFQVGGTASATLTIKEGVKLRMLDNNSSSSLSYIGVLGGSSIRIEGTQSDPVDIRASNSGEWQGIQLGVSSVGNSIEHAVISDGGYQGYNACIDLKANSYLSIDNSTIKDSYTCGVRVDASAQYEAGSNMVYSGNAAGNVCN